VSRKNWIIYDLEESFAHGKVFENQHMMFAGFCYSKTSHQKRFSCRFKIIIESKFNNNLL
jgi:hypothetical protein